MKIQMTVAQNGMAGFKLVSFLGPEKFGLYRGICVDNEAHFDGTTRTNRLPADKAEKMIIDLEISGFEVVLPAVRRQAISGLEKWSENTLHIVAGLDPDHATQRNGVGFSQMDGEFGHSLVTQMGTGLTDKQWAAAVKLAHKYRRQAADPIPAN